MYNRKSKRKKKFIRMEREKERDRRRKRKERVLKTIKRKRYGKMYNVIKD